MHAAALEQDANAFDYDGVYDEMKGEEKGNSKSLVGEGGGGSKGEGGAARR